MSCVDAVVGRGSVSCCEHSDDSAAPSTSCAVSVCGPTSGTRTTRPRTRIDGANATYIEAALECHARGLRICMPTELDDCCSGCGADGNRAGRLPAWTLDHCDERLAGTPLPLLAAAGVALVAAFACWLLLRCLCCCCCGGGGAKQVYVRLEEEAEAERGGSTPPAARRTLRGALADKSRATPPRTKSTPSKSPASSTRPQGLKTALSLPGWKPRSEGWNDSNRVAPARPLPGPDEIGADGMPLGSAYPGGAWAELQALEEEFNGQSSRRTAAASPPSTGRTTGRSSAGSFSMPAGAARTAFKRRIKVARDQLTLATEAARSAQRLLVVSQVRESGGSALEAWAEADEDSTFRS